MHPDFRALQLMLTLCLNEEIRRVKHSKQQEGLSRGEWGAEEDNNFSDDERVFILSQARRRKVRSGLVIGKGLEITLTHPLLSPTYAWNGVRE